jgi:uncharacterized membrane protein
MLWLVFSLLAGMVIENGFGRFNDGAVLMVILGMRASLAPNYNISNEERRLRLNLLFNGTFRSVPKLGAAGGT